LTLQVKRTILYT